MREIAESEWWRANPLVQQALLQSKISSADPDEWDIRFIVIEANRGASKCKSPFCARKNDEFERDGSRNRFRHRERSCPSVPCYQCGQAGHIREECLEYGCNKCGFFGHHELECSSLGEIYPTGPKREYNFLFPNELCRHCKINRHFGGRPYCHAPVFHAKTEKYFPEGVIHRQPTRFSMKQPPSTKSPSGLRSAPTSDIETDSSSSIGPAIKALGPGSSMRLRNGMLVIYQSGSVAAATTTPTKSKA